MISNYSKAIVVTILLGFLAGCMNFTLNDVPQGKESYVVEGLTFAATPYCCTMTATSARCIDGVPVEKDEERLAFGFFPSYECWNKCWHTDNTVGGALTTIFVPPFILGLPYVGALFFEPFVEPAPHSYGIHTINRMSPIGFCKYKKLKVHTEILEGYTIEYNGKQLYIQPGQGGMFRIPNLKKGEKVKIKLISLPDHLADLFKDFIGVEFESVVY